MHILFDVETKWFPYSSEWQCSQFQMNFRWHLMWGRTASNTTKRLPPRVRSKCLQAVYFQWTYAATHSCMCRLFFTVTFMCVCIHCILTYIYIYMCVEWPIKETNFVRLSVYTVQCTRCTANALNFYDICTIPFDSRSIAIASVRRQHITRSITQRMNN